MKKLINVDFTSVEQLIHDLETFLNDEVIEYSSSRLNNLLEIMDTMDGKTNHQQKQNILMQNEKNFLLANGLLSTLEFIKDSSQNMQENDLILGNSMSKGKYQ